MSDTLVPGAASVTESLSRVNGFIHGCGQAALAVILHLYRGEPLSVAEVTHLINQGVAAGQVTDPGGSTTANNLQWLAGQHGLALTQGAGSAWQGVLNDNAGTTPVEVGVSNASVFGGSDAGVGGHWVTVLGRTSSGDYLVADPNQPSSLTGGLQTYTAAQFAKASPFATLTPSGAPNGVKGTPIASTTAGGGIIPDPFSAMMDWIGGHLFPGVQAGDVAMRVVLFVLGALILIAGLYALVSRPVVRVENETGA